LQQWYSGTDITAIAAHPSAMLLLAVVPIKSRSSVKLGGRGAHCAATKVFWPPRLGIQQRYHFMLIYKVSLAAGFIDNTVAVYNSSAAGNHEVYKKNRKANK